MTPARLKNVLPKGLLVSLIAPTLSAATSSPRFYGLSDGSGTFTSSPNRCAISILYDAMRIEWKGGPPKKAQEVHFTMVGNAAAAGLPVTIDLRGMANAEGRSQPQLQLIVGSDQHTLALGSGDFLLRSAARLARHGDSTPVQLRLSLSRPADAGASGLAVLEAVDLTLKGCK